MLRQLVVDELDADAHEFDELRVSVFVFLVGFLFAGGRAADLRQIAQHLEDLCGQARLLGQCAGAQAEQESFAPLAQRLRPLLDRHRIVRQQGLERHLVASQTGRRVGDDRYEWLDSDARRTVHEHFVEPVLRVIGPVNAQGPAQHTVAFGCRRTLARIGQENGEFGQCGGRHEDLCYHRSKTRRSARLTLVWGISIVRRMSDVPSSSVVDQELKRLEKRLEELLVTIARLKEENRALRQRQETLMTERASLLQKNEQVRARVEAMIGRLKAMEHGA